MERQVFRKHLRNVFPRAGEETRCGGNSAWRTRMEPSCPCSCVLLCFSPFPYIPQLLFQLEFPAAPAVAPSQPHPDEGSNKSLQMWAEHFHPQEELTKYTGNVFAFIWQLFRATTDSMVKNNDLPKSLISPRVQWNPGNIHPAAETGIEQKLQEFSVLSQENPLAADVLISSCPVQLSYTPLSWSLYK